MSKEKNEYVHEAGELLQEAGIKALDRVTKHTGTRIVYDKTHKILGLKNDKKR